MRSSGADGNMLRSLSSTEFEVMNEWDNGKALWRGIDNMLLLCCCGAGHCRWLLCVYFRLKVCRQLQRCSIWRERDDESISAYTPLIVIQGFCQ